ncbi:hypothetical protein Q7P37_002255 [Cladosporium fusiforme]
MFNDEVIPFRYWDEQDVLQKLVLEFTYRFDDVLDSAKLKASLERLLEIGDWRSLGARFKKNSSNPREQATGKLEYHIPQRYDAKRPGFMWSQEVFDQRIADHALASRLPTASNLKRPTLFPSSDVFHELVTRQNHATKFSQWTETDLPALSVHIVSFKDATLLTISWSHVFLDGLGRQCLLKAWTAVLNGNEEEIPPFVPFEVDPAGDVASGGHPGSHHFYGYVLTGIWFFLFVLGYMYELFVHSAEAGYMICCPGPWVENLRQQAIADVLATGTDDEKVFLSHGDVLLAWWSKIAVAAQGLRSSQPVNLMNVANLRGLFPEHLPETEKAAYTGNATMSSNTFITSGELDRSSVGELALRLRTDLQRQRTPEQVRHLLVWQRESRQQYGRLPLVGSWNQIRLVWSNWHRARFFDMDFSAAALQPGIPLENRSNKLGQPSLILSTGHANGFSIRNVGPLMGRDANGDWWMQFVLRAAAWERVKKHFERL